MHVHRVRAEARVAGNLTILIAAHALPPTDKGAFPTCNARASVAAASRASARVMALTTRAVFCAGGRSQLNRPAARPRDAAATEVSARV